MKHFASILFAISIFLLLFLNTATAEDGSQPCKDCHADVYREAVTSPFQHSVAREKCITCHSSNSAGSSNQAEGANLRKLISRTFNRAEIFPLKGLQDDIEYRVEIVAVDGDGRSSDPRILEIKPPDLNEAALSPLKAISEVKIEEVKQGIFVSASLFWRTATPATTEVEYGLTRDLEKRLTGGDHYTKDHRISITGLRKGKKYFVRAVSKDIFGNIVRSDKNTLKTSRFFSKIDKAGDSTTTPTIDTVEVFKIENQDAYIAVSLNKPSRIHLDIAEQAGEQQTTVHSFPPERYSTITACLKCHKQGASHPVGIRARKPGIRTPDDLPTIENGMLTCVTCHDPHGSSNQSLARVDFKRNICIKCHVGDTFI